ncbi:hypothetical protein AQUCO_01400198v1 [Aquilegia coerulea]|uniref:Uncharacterized protein n=1 Tax=Aquilegia coerulea TaxID=218851 RepID=A0A2G5DV37_AQUCA|nr:hypothetical protein AQUCO_01400198v1 [Aquilegia coerulea]
MKSNTLKGQVHLWRNYTLYRITKPSLDFSALQTGQITNTGRNAKSKRHENKENDAEHEGRVKETSIAQIRTRWQLRIYCTSLSTPTPYTLNMIKWFTNVTK